LKGGAGPRYAVAMNRSILSAVLSAALCNGAIACGSSEGTSEGDSECHGDEKAWAAITAKPLDCQQNSDCCVVINTCLNEGQVVLSADFEEADKAFPYCGDRCTRCIPPSIQVACVSGKCVGEGKSDVGATDDFRTSHCGSDAIQVMTPAATARFTCGG
jgi:hypothetical protein